MGHLLYTSGHASSDLQRRVVTAFNAKPVTILLRQLSCSGHSLQHECQSWPLLTLLLLLGVQLCL